MNPTRVVKASGLACTSQAIVVIRSRSKFTSGAAGRLLNLFWLGCMSGIDLPWRERLTQRSHATDLNVAGDFGPSVTGEPAACTISHRV